METQTLPVVGMGATAHYISDRYAFTIVQVLSHRKIVVQHDKATRIDRNGLSESQEYVFEPNPQAEKITLTLRKNGLWYKVGDSLQGTRYSIGERHQYQDPSF